MEELRRPMAEFFGVIFVVLIGCGAAVVSSSSIGTLGICFSFGLAHATAHYVAGPISGGHLNPAVSFAFWLRKKISFKEFISYGAAQLLGGAAAALLLYLLMMDKPDFNQMLYSNGFGPHSPGGFPMFSGGLAELLMTSFFILSFFAVSNSKGEASSSLLIGATNIGVYLFLTPFTNGSINPARSFGVALLEGGEALSQVWFFFLVPLAGSVLAVILEKIIIKK
jgi:aquaporin Z